MVDEQPIYRDYSYAFKNKTKKNTHTKKMNLLELHISILYETNKSIKEKKKALY